MRSCLAKDLPFVGRKDREPRVRTALLVHNLVLLACLLLAISNTDSEEILGLAIVINTVSVILDIIILCVFYPR